MDDTLSSLFSSLGGGAIFTAALTQVAKQVGLPTRFAPVVNLIFGLLVVVLINGAFDAGLNGYETVLGGLFAGLSAGGAWDAVKVATSPFLPGATGSKQE